MFYVSLGMKIHSCRVSRCNCVVGAQSVKSNAEESGCWFSGRTNLSCNCCLWHKAKPLKMVPD